MARPRKAPQEKRDDRLNPRLTTAERAEIERTAAVFAISPSEFMRRRSLGYRLPADLAAQQATASLGAAFNRLGVNLNQIARHLNAGGDRSARSSGTCKPSSTGSTPKWTISMVPAVTEGGRSFKGAALYYLHDKRQAGEAERLTSDRVAWTHTVNLSSADPERAWRIMADTAMRQGDIKAAAGEKATGRKLTKPVYAYSLAWHPEQRVDRDHMVSTALDSLKAQELEGYQAIILAHSDEPHQHVHVLVNRVHPETGKAATLSNNTLKLSKWAEAYEKQHGKIYCGKRVENNRRREQGEFVTEPRKPRAAYEFERAAGNDSISAEFIKANEKQKDAQLYEIGRTIKESHARQWEDVKRVYAASRKKITDHGNTLNTAKAAQIKDGYRERWTMLAQTQRAERRELWGREDGFLSRLFNGLSLLREIRQNHEGNAFLIALALISREGHMAALATRHEAERRDLAREIREVTGREQSQIDKGTRADLDRLRGQFLDQCASLRTTQDKQHGERPA